ncbi:helix-turn-helix domain-containing protein [Amorphus sp. MBR-141]
MRNEKVKVGSYNVFADIGYPDAELHQLRARIISEIGDIIDSLDLTQAAAGEIMGIGQPDVSKMLRGHCREYSVERLMGFLTRFSRDVEITVRPHQGDDAGRITFHTTSA